MSNCAEAAGIPDSGYESFRLIAFYLLNRSECEPVRSNMIRSLSIL